MTSPSVINNKLHYDSGAGLGGESVDQQPSLPPSILGKLPKADTLTTPLLDASKVTLESSQSLIVENDPSFTEVQLDSNNINQPIQSESRKGWIITELEANGFKQVGNTNVYKNEHITVYLTDTGIATPKLTQEQILTTHHSKLCKAFVVGVAGLALFVAALLAVVPLLIALCSKSGRNFISSRLEFQGGALFKENRTQHAIMTNMLNKKVTLGAQPNASINWNWHARDQMKTHPDNIAREHRAVFSIQDTWERGAVGFVSPFTAEEWNQRGVDYIEMNVPDHSGMSCEQLESATFVMKLFGRKTHDARTNPQQGIYVHCKAGQGRSAQAIVADNVMNDGKNWVDSSITVQQKRNGVTTWKPEKTDSLKPFQSHAEFREIEREIRRLEGFSEEEKNKLIQEVEKLKNDKRSVLAYLKDYGKSFHKEYRKLTYDPFIRNVEEIYKKRSHLHRKFFINSVAEIRGKKGQLQYRLRTPAVGKKHKSKGKVIWSGDQSEFFARISKSAMLAASSEVIQALKEIGQPLSLKEEGFLLTHSQPSSLYELEAIARIFSNNPERKAVFDSFLQKLGGIRSLKSKPEKLDPASVERQVKDHLKSLKPHLPSESRPIQTSAEPNFSFLD